MKKGIIAGIDVSRAVEMNPGIRSYILGLISGFAELSNQHKYILYPFFFECFPPEFKKFKIPLGKNISIRWNWLPEYIISKLWHSTWLPLKHKLGPIDIAHSTAFTSPSLGSVPLVVTVHDLSFITHPECHFQENIDFCKEQIRLMKHNAAAVITDSESTRKDLIDKTGWDESLITTVHLAVDHNRFYSRTQQEVRDFRKKYQLPDSYILFVGSVEPRKNLKTLIKTMKHLIKEPGFTGKKLVIAGGKGWKNKDIFELPETLGIEKYVRFLGIIPDNELPMLYSGADLFVYPSLYEGFGLPVLEAMACGVPVVASNVSSLPEIIGNAGILVDPYDEEDLKSKISMALTNPEIHNDYKQKGLKRALQFTWAETARKTLDVYLETIRKQL